MAIEMAAVEYLIPLVEFVVVVAILVVLGALCHEMGHWAIGRAFGGETFISQYYYGIPSQTDFSSPRNMTDLQVRITGGWPVVFLPLLFAGFWLHSFPLITFAAGAALTISALDMNAIHHPEFWKKMTAGETIHPEDYR